MNGYCCLWYQRLPHTIHVLLKIVLSGKNSEITGGSKDKCEVLFCCLIYKTGILDRATSDTFH